MEPLTWIAKVKSHFLDRDERVPVPFVGDQVAGVVVARAPFGVWLDVGSQLPALLEVIYFEGASERRYAYDDYPAVGQELLAQVVRVQVEGSFPQIRLSQGSG